MYDHRLISLIAWYKLRLTDIVSGQSHLHFNRPECYLTTKQAWRAVRSLLQSGDINITDAAGALVTLPQLTHREDLKGLHVGLTASGGARWEDGYQPRWHDFMELFGTYLKIGEERTGALKIVCCDSLRGEAALDRCLRTLGSSCERTVKWKRETPFAPFYWKTVPEGFTITISHGEGMFMSDTTPLRHSLGELLEWYDGPDERWLGDEED